MDADQLVEAHFEALTRGAVAWPGAPGLSPVRPKIPQPRRSCVLPR